MQFSIDVFINQLTRLALVLSLHVALLSFSRFSCYLPAPFSLVILFPASFPLLLPAGLFISAVSPDVQNSRPRSGPAWRKHSGHWLWYTCNQTLQHFNETRSSLNLFELLTLKSEFSGFNQYFL